MSPREELARLVAQHRLGVYDPEDLAAKAYLIGVEAAWRMDQEVGSVFRIVDHQGNAVTRRVWAGSGPAKLSLRHSYGRGRVQEGKVIWLKEGDSE